MDLGNQARIKELAEKYGKDDIVVIIGGAEAEASGLAVETVANGDPAFAGPLAGVQLGLKAYHVVEPEIKDEIDADVYDEQVGMMEMVLDVDAIIAECRSIREQFLGSE
jgi:betaine reductase